MSTIATKLSTLLNPVSISGDFYASGSLEIYTPSLEVEGVGPVSIPLLPLQIEQLIQVADQAPYGRGEETIVDTNVRRTWQINADRVQIKGRHWPKTMKTIVKQVTEHLGVKGTVTAELYKLLVYDTGSFFVSHRDTEKADGMFATLVIVLPSIYSGGELLVSHKNTQMQFDLRCPEPSDAAFAAFYADCEHEVLPVTSGCRLTLIYNLLLKDRKRTPQPPSHVREETIIATLLREWTLVHDSQDEESQDEESQDEESQGGALPVKLVYPLEHAYTKAGIAFDMLKGADAARSSVLVNAAQQADCDIHLALLSIEESGAAEYTGGYRRRGSWYDDDEGDDDPTHYEEIEVYDHSETLSDWQRPDGSPSELGPLPFSGEEFVPTDTLESVEDIEPDREDFHEATGNEGASFDRTYHRAVLVLWPHKYRLAVFCQGGLTVTLPYLKELTDKWRASGEQPHSPLWNQAHVLAGYMLVQWPSDVRPSWRSEVQGGDEAKMLSLLVQLQDSAHIEMLLIDITSKGVYGSGDNAAIVKALALLPVQKSITLLTMVVKANVSDSLHACINLLEKSRKKLPKINTADLIPVATVVWEFLPGQPQKEQEANAWRRADMVKVDFIVDLINTIGQIDVTLLDQIAELILDFPQLYDIDKTLVPALVKLAKQNKVRTMAAFQHLKTVCLDHLQKRIAESLEPPSDWKRSNQLTCHCSHCGKLKKFLANPEEKMWNFKASAPQRGHVEGTIRNSGCDVDCSTETRGRPYTLVCTKNLASYQRRAGQRQEDLAAVKKLNASGI